MVHKHAGKPPACMHIITITIITTTILSHLNKYKHKYINYSIPRPHKVEVETHTQMQKVFKHTTHTHTHTDTCPVAIAILSNTKEHGRGGVMPNAFNLGTQEGEAGRSLLV
jgi:hypothetical protein